MKYKIVKHYSKESGRLVSFELKERPLFFLPWKSLRLYKRQQDIEHDIVWLMSMDGKVKETAEYD